MADSEAGGPLSDPLEFPTYGYRRLTVEFRPHVGRINSKRLRRLMRQRGLSRNHKRKKRHTPQSQHDYPRYPNLVRDLAIERPNQVGVADITYIHLQTEEVYLSEYRDFHDAYYQIGRFLDDVYARKRIHFGIAEMTGEPVQVPAEHLDCLGTLVLGLRLDDVTVDRV